MITASVSAGSSLLLEPARELQFPLPDVTSVHRPRCLLTLTNVSVANDVVFRIRIRNPDAFTVRPTHGLLAPGSSSQVVVTATARSCERLGAMHPRDLITRQSSELFLVQSVEREEEVQAMEPLDPNSSTSLRTLEGSLTRTVVSCTGSRASLQESQASQSDKQVYSLSARESRLSHSGWSSSGQSKLHRSFSNHSTLSEESRERSRQQSFGSDASFYTIIEPPLRMDRRRSETGMPALTDDWVSRTSRTSQHDNSLSVNNSSVSDTVLSALTAFSTDTATKESTRELGPLLYHIEPSDTLSFNVTPAPHFWGSTSCFIVNSSQNDCLTFKVRTSNQSGYVVKPSRGLVSTTNAQEVVILLCPPRHEKSFDATEREAKDGFMVEIANISRDKYDDLMKLDEQKRFHEITSLWAHLPRGDRQSTMLSVKLNMEKSHIGSSIFESFKSCKPGFQSESIKGKAKTTKRQMLESVVQGLTELSTSSPLDKSHGCVAEDKVNDEYSNLDEFASTIAPIPELLEAGKNNSDVPAYHASRDSKVFVVSADRMDTVDFSNPKLSFFI